MNNPQRPLIGPILMGLGVAGLVLGGVWHWNQCQTRATVEVFQCSSKDMELSFETYATINDKLVALWADSRPFVRVYGHGTDDTAVLFIYATMGERPGHYRVCLDEAVKDDGFYQIDAEATMQGITQRSRVGLVENRKVRKPWDK